MPPVLISPPIVDTGTRAKVDLRPHASTWRLLRVAVPEAYGAVSACATIVTRR
jgi:hypothetical protein